MAASYNFNFDIFVNNLNNKLIYKNTHYTPQACWVECYKYDFIGRYENLDDGIKTILIQMGKESAFKNFKVHNASNRKPFQHYISNKNTFNKIVKLYQKDFELFNYSTDYTYYIENYK